MPTRNPDASCATCPCYIEGNDIAGFCCRFPKWEAVVQSSVCREHPDFWKEE